MNYHKHRELCDHYHWHVYNSTKMYKQRWPLAADRTRTDMNIPALRYVLVSSLSWATDTSSYDPETFGVIPKTYRGYTGETAGMADINLSNMALSCMATLCKINASQITARGLDNLLCALRHLEVLD